MIIFSLFHCRKAKQAAVAPEPVVVPVPLSNMNRMIEEEDNMPPIDTTLQKACHPWVAKLNFPVKPPQHQNLYYVDDDLLP